MTEYLKELRQSSSNDILEELALEGFKEKSEELIKLFKEKYRIKYPRAVESLEEAEDRLLSYFSFPKAHWKSIKTTNPIESIFATVKLRTNTARRINPDLVGIVNQRFI